MPPKGDIIYGTIREKAISCAGKLQDFREVFKNYFQFCVASRKSGDFRYVKSGSQFWLAPKFAALPAYAERKATIALVPKPGTDPNVNRLEN